jgi:hypothetical protein
MNGRDDLTWNKLSELRSEVDVALVQEVAPPSAGWRRATELIVCPPVDEARELRTPNDGYPARIVALHPDIRLHERPLHEARSHPGTLAVADVLFHDDRVMTIASAYGMLEDRDFSDRSMHLILDDLEPMLASESAQLVLGGDFNMWTQPWNGAPREPYRRAFDRIASLGLFDCLQSGVDPRRDYLAKCPCGDPASCTHVRTLRHMNSADSTPWQVDYLFASEDLKVVTSLSWESSRSSAPSGWPPQSPVSSASSVA